MADKPAPPFPFTLALLGAGVACFAVSSWAANQEALPPYLSLLPLLAGSALVAVALVERFKAAGWDFPSRVETAVHTSVAGAAAVLTSLFGLPQEWDSLRRFYGGMFMLLLAGTVLVLLPSVPRKILLSLWVLYHFSGMFAVFASIDPPNGTGPWLAKQLWTVAYRPYLQFLYLTNAYHFYSPDPGPPAMFWFAVRYEDGKWLWVKLPDRADSPVGMHYQRILALPEHSFVPLNRVAYNEAEREAIINRNSQLPESHRGEVPSKARTWEQVYARRYNAPNLLYGAQGLPIPLVADLDVLRQYREPTDASRRLVASVSRVVLANAPARKRDDGTPIEARSTRAYRLVQNCLTPFELTQRADPYAKTKYMPYYLGEYDRKGVLLDEEDPFLYWYLPRLYVPKNYPAHHAKALGPVSVNANVFVPSDPKDRDSKFVLLDCLELHAEGVRTEKPKEKK